jgi:hypothetical protein
MNPKCPIKVGPTLADINNVMPAVISIDIRKIRPNVLCNGDPFCINIKIVPMIKAGNTVAK